MLFNHLGFLKIMERCLWKKNILFHILKVNTYYSQHFVLLCHLDRVLVLVCVFLLYYDSKFIISYHLFTVTSSEDSCVYFLDIEKESNCTIKKLQGHACVTLGVAFNYDETILATSDVQGIIIIWSRQNQQQSL